MKLSNVKVVALTGATAAALSTALSTFFAGAGEKVFVSVDFQVISGEYSALVLYTT